MIYLDNAATTMHKPTEVVAAVTSALESFGGVGRGVHGASIDAGMTVYRARSAVAKLLGAPNASRVAFGMNATDALNTAILGLMRPGDHAVTTAASHNSVLRPLRRLADEQGCSFNVARIDAHGQLDWDDYLRLLGVTRTDDGAFAKDPSSPKAVRLVVATHASNLTGDVYDAPAMAQAAHTAGAIFILDAAQTAGVVPIDMNRDGYDVVCFTGHKSLYGPQGTGGLAVADGIDIHPLKEGGSGIKTYEVRHPLVMPERLEAGTLNAHGLAGLAAGIRYVNGFEYEGPRGVAALGAKGRDLTAALQAGLERIPGITVYGGPVQGRTGVVAFNLADEDSGTIADMLSNDYDIATRAGGHCAPLMHGALGTVEQGAVRMSVSSFTTPQEIDLAIEAVSAIAMNLMADQLG